MNDNEYDNLVRSSDSNKSTDEEENGLSLDSNESTDEEDDDLENTMSIVNQFIPMKTRSGGKNVKKKNSDKKLLLVYPFDLDESALEEAVSGLKELGGDSLGVESEDGEPPTDVRTQPNLIETVQEAKHQWHITLSFMRRMLGDYSPVYFSMMHL